MTIPQKEQQVISSLGLAAHIISTDESRGNHIILILQHIYVSYKLTVASIINQELMIPHWFTKQKWRY